MVGSMKKIVAFVMFVFVFAQSAHVMDAFAESLYHNAAQGGIVAESISDDVPDTSKSLLEHAKSCQNSCQGHCHSHHYMNVQMIKVSSVRKQSFLNTEDQLFTDHTYGPDSPPPDFS